MKPIRTAQTNCTYLAPRGREPEICDLPCARIPASGVVVSVWQPTPEEREAIAKGYNVELYVWGEPIPPVGVGVTHLQELREPRGLPELPPPGPPPRSPLQPTET